VYTRCLPAGAQMCQTAKQNGAGCFTAKPRRCCWAADVNAQQPFAIADLVSCLELWSYSEKPRRCCWAGGPSGS